MWYNDAQSLLGLNPFGLRFLQVTLTLGVPLNDGGLSAVFPLKHHDVLTFLLGVGDYQVRQWYHSLPGIALVVGPKSENLL